MTVNGVQGLTEIDTGAGVTILNEETFTVRSHRRRFVPDFKTE